jgi:hypothetical protein
MLAAVLVCNCEVQGNPAKVMQCLLEMKLCNASAQVPGQALHGGLCDCVLGVLLLASFPVCSCAAD